MGEEGVGPLVSKSVVLADNFGGNGNNMFTGTLDDYPSKMSRA